MKNRRLAISIALSVFIIILIVVYMLTIGDNPYGRWEYVNRNFGDAQVVWVVNPVGTKYMINNF